MEHERQPEQSTVPIGDGRRHLLGQTFAALVAAGLLLAAAQIYIAIDGTLGTVSALISVGIYVTVGAIVASRILAFHPFSVFGWPNAVTLLRTVMTALVAGYTAEISLWTLPPSSHLAWAFAAMASVAVTLDGLDGWLARRLGPRSAFGARFDMESDALLILILSVLAFVLGKAGIWVILIGGLRYGFLAASFVLPWMEAPLPPSARRKIVCVIQSAALCLLAMPIVTGTPAVWIAGAALVLLTWSFAIDCVWLFRHREPAAGIGKADG